MLSQRTLVVVAIVVLLVPALGAATPIVLPPLTEPLVEGHSVFTVIDLVARQNVTRASFAAAVAVLVRENRAVQNAQRFPGVLWFNDQYLVDPFQAENTSRSLRDVVMGNPRWRYPCGGAVLAVNQGDPDPRVAIAQTNLTGLPAPLPESLNHSSPRGSEEYDNDLAWLDAEVNATNATAPSASVRFDTMPPSRFEYRESYLITDPNDHSWIVDVYVRYLSDTLLGPLHAPSYNHTVWVVNMLGSPVFIPDDGESSCVPFADLLDLALLGPFCQNADDVQGVDGQPLDCGQSRLHDQTCGTHVPNGYDTGTGRPGFLGSSPYVDDPCAGYAEPSRNGYCYGGQLNASTTPCSQRSTYPHRTYNALLYMKLEDLRVAGDPRDHSDPVNSTDTNGCDVPTTYAANASDEWPCPGGDDDAEGNSHPFHPPTGAHTHAEPCPAAFAGPNPTNHGGSTDPAARCDYVHATRNIDLYFGNRPFPPPVRRFDIIDVEGSDAPFQGFHDAYPGVT